MAELKTQPTDQSVEAFLNGVADAQTRQDCFTLMALMRELTGAEPTMWGSSIVGFGHYHYTFASGRSGDWFVTGFSPRKQNLTLYLATGFEPHNALLAKLGKHKTGKACLYVKRLADIDMAALRELVKRSVEHLSKTDS